MESQGLDKVEESKDNPVSQPLNVILISGGLDGQVGGKSPTEEIGNGCSERVEGMKEEERNGTDDEVSLGNLNVLPGCLQGGVVVELPTVM